MAGRCGAWGWHAPEKGEPFGEQATQTLNRLVGGNRVRLELGQPGRDRDGRLLAYVFADQGMINTQLVSLGMAYVRRPVARKYRTAFAQAQEQARAAGRQQKHARKQSNHPSPGGCDGR